MARFARDPRGDRTNLSFDLPRFLELVPPPGRATVDVGCGEGRLGAERRAEIAQPTATQMPLGSTATP